MSNKPNAIAASIIERTALARSTSVLVYDLAEQIGFGTLTKEWQRENKNASKVETLETRAGAGFVLAGRLSERSSYETRIKNNVLTAYTTPSGVAAMASGLSYLPKATPTSRLVIQVPTVTSLEPSLELSPTLAPFSPVLFQLHDNISIVLSSSPQESIDISKAVYLIGTSHVVHFFDQYNAAREVGHSLAEIEPGQTEDVTDIKQALQQFGYSFFDYRGDPHASEVIVLLNGPLASAASAFAESVSGLGIIVVRVLRPWDSTLFSEALHASVKNLHVLDEVLTEGAQGNLFGDVFAACLDITPRRPAVHALRIVPSQTQTFINKPSSFKEYLSQLTRDTLFSTLSEPNPTGTTKKLLFLGNSDSPLSALPNNVVSTFAGRGNLQARSITDFDLLSKADGIAATRVLLSTGVLSQKYTPFHVDFPLGKEEAGVDLLTVYEPNILNTRSVIPYLRADSVLLLIGTWSALEVQSNLSKEVIGEIQKKKISVYSVNVKTLDPSTENIVAHLVFLRLYLGPTADEQALKRLAQVIYGSSSNLAIDKINAKAWSSLEEVEISHVVEGSSGDTMSNLKIFISNSLTPDLITNQQTLPHAHLNTWHEAARHILFPEAYKPIDLTEPSQEEYAQNPNLRPELPERTFLVTCSVNRRLTPLDYDRNVFHLEFDTSGTGLTYAIGEALGVHGWNDSKEVLEFCEWYGVDPDRLVTLPVLGGGGKVHTRTVFQALQQQIDIFGKPPKSFYSDLSELAIKKEDKLSLQFIGSAEGSATFKKLSEKDTVTFADVLIKYKSARPSIERLCELVGDIEPRHYSIASAQSVVGDRVDLLVVTVEWTTPSGSPRYGQCTRYLAGLRVGQKVTVSIKPSVMKLPPDNMQPLVLAGLGTGAAPFRAFLQHRAHLSMQGVPVGPLYYYFGSRYRSKEYLYGEEIEAFILDKTITKAGLAFSRDSKRKVYIQQKMVEDAEDLAKMLYTDKGVFYLCGPTWPVPDVYEALVGALIKYNGLDRKAAGDYLEGLKEEERYVLEVY